jgi:6-phosphogluconolactonase/glucosamine-6-phosphate isomerase/deaminase
VNIVEVPDQAALAELSAGFVARRLSDAVRRRGAATAAFSGGSTPGPMLARLAALPVPWGQVTVFQVDERVAPDGHEARNSALLDVLPAAACVRLMPVTDRSLDRAARRYAALLPDRFDIVHLGMGSDGHTASWPPGDPVVRSVEPVAVVGPYAGWPRLTLTARVVNGARCRLVCIAGESKAPMLMRWLLHDRSLPITAVRRTHTTVYTTLTPPIGSPS